MKIRIQDSNKFLNVNIEHPYLLGNPEVYEKELKPKIEEAIDKYSLKCDGCGKPLKNKDWICVNHRPKSARIYKETLTIENEDTGESYGEGEIELKNIWAIFLFCYDTGKECFDKWKDRRPK